MRNLHKNTKYTKYTQNVRNMQNKIHRIYIFLEISDQQIKKTKKMLLHIILCPTDNIFSFKFTNLFNHFTFFILLN